MADALTPAPSIAGFLRDEVAAGVLSWWYLSFADERFLGAVIVRAFGMADAIRQAHLKKINPGGSVMSVQAPQGFNPPEWAVDRLLSKEDVQRMDAEIAARDQVAAR